MTNDLQNITSTREEQSSLYLLVLSQCVSISFTADKLATFPWIYQKEILLMMSSVLAYISMDYQIHVVHKQNHIQPLVAMTQVFDLSFFCNDKCSYVSECF